MTFLLLLGQYVSSETDKEKIVIRVRGSDSVAARVEKIAKLFLKENPNYSVVVSGGAKGIGLAALYDKTGEVAMAARKINDEEKKEAAGQGLNLEERLIGYGGIAMVINSANPLNELALEQIQKILTGDFTNWQQVGGSDARIQVVGPSPSLHEGTIYFLEHDLLENHPITKSALNAGSFDSVLKTVAGMPMALGFTRVRDVEAYQDHANLKVLKIKPNADSPAIELSRAAIADGIYPIKRPFFLYYDRNIPPDVKKFVDFVISKGWGPQKID